MSEGVLVFRLHRTRDLLVMPVLAVVMTVLDVSMVIETGLVAVAAVGLLVTLPMLVIWAAAVMRTTRATLSPKDLVISGPFGRWAAVPLARIEDVRVGYGRWGRHVHVVTATNEVVIDFDAGSDQGQVMALLEALAGTVARYGFDRESVLLLECAHLAKIADESDSTNPWVSAARHAAAGGRFWKSRILYGLAGDDLTPQDREVLDAVRHITALSRRVQG